MTLLASRWRRLLVCAAAVLALPLAPAAQAAPAAPDGDAGTQVVARLRLLDLRCLAENDSFGSDEPYITVNGSRVWSAGNVDGGDIELVNYSVDFDSAITVELWEDDGGLTGGDDRMATWFFFDSEAGGGIRSVDSQFTAGWYRLRYEVTAV